MAWIDFASLYLPAVLVFFGNSCQVWTYTSFHSCKRPVCILRKAHKVGPSQVIQTEMGYVCSQQAVLDAPGDA